jgi:hypothetical protein
MSKIKDPTILFQYKTAPSLVSLLEGLKGFVINNSKEDIFRFFNIDDAAGLWLDQLGSYLNVKRPLIILPSNSNLFTFQGGEGFQFQGGEPFQFNILTSDQADTFIMDLSLMDGQDLLDGTAFAPDDLYKAFLKGQISKRNSRFTVDDLISALQFIIPESIIFIEEGIKCLTIYAGVAVEQDKINLNLLNDLDPKWFGTPSGVCIQSFNTYTMPVGANFLIMDSNSMDDNNFLMA